MARWSRQAYPVSKKLAGEAIDATFPSFVMDRVPRPAAHAREGRLPFGDAVGRASCSGGGREEAVEVQANNRKDAVSCQQ